MVSLNSREKLVLDYIFEFWDEYKNAPSIVEIVERTIIPFKAVKTILRNLQAKSYIDYVRVRKRWIIVPLFKP